MKISVFKWKATSDPLRWCIHTRVFFTREDHNSRLEKSRAYMEEHLNPFMGQLTFSPRLEQDIVPFWRPDPFDIGDQLGTTDYHLNSYLVFESEDEATMFRLIWNY